MSVDDQNRRPASPAITIYEEPRRSTPLTAGTPADERGRLLLDVWSPVARELLKLAVIIISIVFGVSWAFSGGTPLIFGPLLLWALGGRPGTIIRFKQS